MTFVSMKTIREKKYYIILGVVIILIIGGIFFVYRFIFLKNNKALDDQGAGQIKALTDEQKQDILKELDQNSSSTKPLSVQEKTKVLKKISTTTKPLSDDEKMKILESLGK